MFNCYFPEFRFGFADLKNTLDMERDLVLTIAEDLKISNEGRMSIIFADYGGGNPILSFLNYLKMHLSDLTFETFRGRLVHHKCIDAKTFLDKYKTEVMFKEISHIDTRELSFQLVLPLGSNINIWKDLASDFNLSQVEISKIDRSLLQPNKFSRTEKLFDNISMQFPHYTIGEFREKLKSFNVMSAYNLMEDKIIEAIQRSKVDS